MRRALTLTLVLLLGLSSAFALTACGDDTKVVTDTNSQGEKTVRTVADVKFAKTQFVAHMGLAYGAFRRYIQRPYNEGRFTNGADGRTAAIAKAALAAAFSYSELKRAHKAAQSDDTLRKKLLDPFDRLLDRFGGAVGTLEAGRLPDVAALIGSFAGIKELAKAAGVDFNAVAGDIPGL